MLKIDQKIGDIIEMLRSSSYDFQDDEINKVYNILVNYEKKKQIRKENSHLRLFSIPDDIS